MLNEILWGQLDFAGFGSIEDFSPMTLADRAGLLPNLDGAGALAECSGEGIDSPKFRDDVFRLGHCSLTVRQAIYVDSVRKATWKTYTRNVYWELLLTYNTQGAYMIVTEELKKLRERAGLSMQAVAKLMGLAGGSSYQRYENPVEFTKEALPQHIVRALISALVGKGDPPIAREEVLRLSGFHKLAIKDGSEGILLSGLKETPLKKAVPVIGADQLEMLGKETGKRKDTDKYVSIDSDVEVSDEAFCLIVTDNSMEPKFNIGDKLICDPKIDPRPGDFVIGKLDEDLAASVRRYRLKGTENGRPIIELVPLNPDYPTQIISDTSPGKIYARVVEQRLKV